jgi:hypothetical protein
VPVIPFLFFSSALVLGGGVLLGVSGLRQQMMPDVVLRVVLACLVADFAAWGLYIRLPRDIHIRKTTAYLRRPFPLFAVMGLGHLLPLILLTWLLVTAGESRGEGVAHGVAAATGFCMLAGGAAQKIVLILGANLLRGVTMGGPRGINLIREESHLGKK